jgi:hypothetical protein
MASIRQRRVTWPLVKDVRRDEEVGVDTPTLPRLIIAKSRLSPSAWDSRVDKARRAEELMKALAERRAKGLSLNQAISELLPPSRRGWAIRHWSAYRRDGFEGLIDARLPREPKQMRACKEAVEVARLANPTVTVAEVLKILEARHLRPMPSKSTIQRIFTRVDDRRRYAEKKQQRANASCVELPFAGGELLLAAEAESQILSTLVHDVVHLGREVIEKSGDQTPTRDVGHRDARGRFTAEYNRQRRRKPGEPIASYLRSAHEKAEGQVLSGLRFVHEQPATLEAKIRMLAFESLVNPTKGWDGLRVDLAQGLEPLTGYAYMPSTLAKLTSGLARCNAGPRLLQALGEQAHCVAQERWGEAGAIAAFYIDNHAKEVWSSLFTRSGKVTHLNRVMPCITTTYIHSETGTPLLVVVQSGAAPLAPRVVELVEQQESVLGDGVHRAVVIDAEGSTFDLLETFIQKQRVIVTPLKPSRISELELSYAPGSYFRPYRGRDELRIANAVLHHKTTHRSIELDALIVRRQHRESDTILLTNGVRLGMSGRELATLYYRRWPIQENAFKEGEAVRLAEHRGNCGTIVSNIVVVGKLSKLEKQASVAKEKLRHLDEEREAVAHARQESERATRMLVERHHQLAELATNEETSWEALGQGLRDHQEAQRQEQACAQALRKAESKETANEACRAKVTEELKRVTEERETLEPQQTIRQLDTALDSVLTAVKLATSFLIAFVLREYLGSKPMTATAFVAHVLSIRGRREIRPDEERIVFYENPRDPEINDVLTKACAQLNERNLQREGRLLRYSLEAPPKKPP